MIKRIYILLIFMSSIFLHSQIVNVENFRVEKDTVGWSGYAVIDLEIQKNANSIFALSNEFRLEYRTKKSLWFFINDLEFKKINSAEIINKSTQHLRFSHDLSSKISFEAFTQTQTDKIAEIQLRALLGSGLRFRLYSSRKYNFSLGTTIMFEYEDSIDIEEEEIIHNDFRKSMYFSFKIKPNSTVSIISTNYYQPLLTQISDYRILSETSITIKVVKNLKFLTTFSYEFDSFPVLIVPKEQYKLTNGLVYSF